MDLFPLKGFRFKISQIVLILFVFSPCKICVSVLSGPRLMYGEFMVIRISRDIRKMFRICDYENILRQ